MKEGRVKATVRVVMDVEADSVWGSGTTWDQISKQAEDGVRGLLTSGNKFLSEQIPRRIKSLEVVHVVVYPEGSNG